MRSSFAAYSQMLARLVEVSQPQAGDSQPELEFMVIRIAIDLLGELVPCSLEVAQPHGREPAVEEMKRRVGLDPRQPAVQNARFGDAPLLFERQRQVGECLGVPGLALKDIAENPLGLRRVAVAQVDHAESVVSAQELGILPERRACPPVGVVQPASNKRLGGPIVHVHRNDGLLGDDPGTQPA